jgi:hypothetical protein
MSETICVISAHYTTTSRFALPVGLELKMDDYEKTWFIKWNTLYYTGTDGKEYMLEAAEDDNTNGDCFKYPHEVDVDEDDAEAFDEPPEPEIREQTKAEQSAAPPPVPEPIVREEESESEDEEDDFWEEVGRECLKRGVEYAKKVFHLRNSEVFSEEEQKTLIRALLGL